MVNLNDFPAAETQFREAVRLDSGDPIVVLNLGLALKAQGKWEGAEDAFRKAVAMSPERVSAYDRLIECLLAESKLAEAESLCVERVKRFPKDPYGLYLLGGIYAQGNKMAEAVKQWELASEAETPPEFANFQLGNYWRANGKLSLAAGYYEREVQNYPNNIEALNNLAGITAARDPNLAIRYFDRVLKLAPSYYQAAYNIAALQIQLGETETAVKGLQAILQSAPDFEPAKKLLESINAPASQPE